MSPVREFTGHQKGIFLSLLYKFFFYSVICHSPAVFIFFSVNILVNCSGDTSYLTGVIAMEWCPSDSSYLLTCAKDNRTICWDTNTAEVVGRSN